MDKRLKSLAVLAICLLGWALLLALVSDYIIMGNETFGLIKAMFSSIIFFTMGIVFFVASLILLFGFILLVQYGFWPLDWGMNGFVNSMEEYNMTLDKMKALFFSRLIIVIFILVALILAISAISQLKKARKIDRTVSRLPVLPMSIPTIVLSAMYLLFSSACLILFLYIIT